MSHRNAPLTPAGRLRPVQRCQYRPIAHVAAEAGVSRQCLSKWVGRYRREGEQGLLERSSAPRRQPTSLHPDLVADIEQLRRDKKWSARLIAAELSDQGQHVSTATVSRWLVRLGLNRRRWLDVDGEPLRTPGKITARYRGHMIHLDVKKVGRIPDGGGWRVHGRHSTQNKQVDQAKTRRRAGRLHLPALRCRRLLPPRLHRGPARRDRQDHDPFLGPRPGLVRCPGITRITRVVTDNGSCYRSKAFTQATSHAARHQRTKPYTPKHNGKVERYQRILAEELLYARAFTSEAQRAQALQVWNVHYNYHRLHTAARNQPPAARLGLSVTNVLRSYS